MGAGEPMTAVVGGERAGAKPLLTVLAWSVGAVSLAAFAAAWVLAARNRDLVDISAGFSPDRFMVAYPVVGAVLASRRRSNPIGWLVLGVGIVTAARALAGEYALHALAGPAHPPPGVWAAWFVGWSLSLLFPGGLLTFLLLLFPGGHPLTPRWWAVGWAAAGLGAITVVLIWLAPTPITVDGLPSLPNPTALRGELDRPWSTSGSTGPVTTPNGWLRSFPSSCAKKSISMCLAPTWLAWCITSWPRRTWGYGSAAPSARRPWLALDQTIHHRQPPTLATCTYRSQSASRDVRMSA